MTVATTVNYVRTVANGSVTAFDFTFPVFSSSELEIYTIVRSTGVSTLKTLTTHYTVALNTATPGGTITFLSAPASTLDVYIRRVVPYTQTADIPSGGNFPEVQIENQLDRLVMMIQQLAETVGRAFTVTIGSSVTVLTLPTPEDGKILAWNGTNGTMQNIADPTNAAAASATAAASSASAASTSASSASSSASSATSSASAAAVSAAAAAASAASLTGVAFAVYNSANISVNNSTTLKMTFDTEMFDVGGYFASSKFTPLVAGKYLITAKALVSGLNDTEFSSVNLYKNGSVLTAGGTSYGMSVATTSNPTAEVTAIVEMNGSTDYIEMFVSHNHASALNVSAGVYLAGCKVA